jgi:hypothetical protein
LTLGLVGGYPATVEYECSACALVFTPKPQRGGYLNLEQQS